MTKWITRAGIRMRVPGRTQKWWQRNKYRLQGKRDPRRTAARSLVVHWALWGVQHEPQIHYSESASRDDWLHEPAGRLPISTDCSGFATLCYHQARLPDPNGLGYGYLGNTATLLSHAQAHGHILTDIALAKPGDLIVIGPGGGDHVVVVIHKGSDPTVVSHGAEGGPVRQLLSVDGRTPKRVCRTLP